MDNSLRVKISDEIQPDISEISINFNFYQLFYFIKIFIMIFLFIFHSFDYVILLLKLRSDTVLSILAQLERVMMSLKA